MRKLMLSIVAFVTLGTGTALACQEFPQQHHHQQAVRSDKVQIQWGASWYAGTILDQRGAQYLVRYDGYSSAWDEWVGPDRLRFEQVAVYQQPVYQEPVYQPPTHHKRPHWKKDRWQRQWR
jgi:hypothetical protein